MTTALAPMANHLLLLGVAVAAGLLFAIVGAFSASSAAQPSAAGNQGQGNGTGQSMPMVMNNSSNNNNNNQSPSYLYKLDNKYRKYENGVFHVRAGGGNAISPMTWYFPRIAEIKVGETVTWINPTSVGEPHTVTFILDNNTATEFAAPFVISDGNANLTSAVPNANAEAVVMPGPNGTKIVVAANNRSISPTIIKADGNVTTFPPNGNYTMDGTEKYVNSGWIWPSGQSPPGFPPINTFSVKFTKAGTYNYMCEVHPWMTGEVVVK